MKHDASPLLAISLLIAFPLIQSLLATVGVWLFLSAFQASSTWRLVITLSVLTLSFIFFSFFWLQDLRALETFPKFDTYFSALWPPLGVFFLGVVFKTFWPGQ